MKAMLAAAVLPYGAAVRRVRGGIHLGSGLIRIGIVDVRHGSLVANVFWFSLRLPQWRGYLKMQTKGLAALKPMF